MFIIQLNYRLFCCAVENVVSVINKCTFNIYTYILECSGNILTIQMYIVRYLINFQYLYYEHFNNYHNLIENFLY